LESIDFHFPVADAYVFPVDTEAFTEDDDEENGEDTN
jgi:hypothetical protein